MWWKADTKWKRRWSFLAFEDRTALCWLKDVAFDEGGLTADLQMLADISGTPKDILERVWRYIERDFENRAGRWMLPEQWAALDWLALQAESGRKGGQERARRAQDRKSAERETQDLEQGTLKQALDGNFESENRGSKFASNDVFTETQDLEQGTLKAPSRLSKASQADKNKREAPPSAKPQEKNKFSSEARARFSPAMFAAVKKLFPGSAPHNLENTASICCDVEIEAEMIAGWEDWHKSRWPRSEPSVFRLRDTVRQYARERLHGVFNGSCGAKFIAHATGAVKGSQLTQQQVQEFIRLGEHLDTTIAKGLSEAEWRARGWTGDKFAEFWADQKEQDMLPKPESVTKYFHEFRAWVEQQWR